MAEIAGLVLSVVPLFLKTYSILQPFIETVNEAPTEVKVLFYRVKDFESILDQMKQSTIMSNEVLDSKTLDAVRHTILRGKDILHELNKILAKLNNTDGYNQIGKIKSMKWALKEKHRAEDLQKNLSYCTQTLSIIFDLVNSRKMDAILSKTYNIDTTLNTMSAQMMQITSAIQETATKSETIIVQNTKTQYVASSEAIPKLTDTRSVSRIPATFAQTISTYRQSTTLSSYAERDCSLIRCTCCCHSTIRRLSMPGFLHRLLGRVEFQYTGPSQGKSVLCNMKTCRRYTAGTKNSVASINIDFPTWFVNSIATIKMAPVDVRLASGISFHINMTTSRGININDCSELRWLKEAYESDNNDSVISAFCSTLLPLLESGKLSAQDRIHEIDDNRNGYTLLEVFSIGVPLQKKTH